MKKYKSILPFIVAVTLLFVGCKKDDGFIPDEYLTKLTAIPVVSVAVNTTGDQAIKVNPTSFQGKFDVSLYFTDKAAPSKIDIVVRKNGSNSNVKVFQAGVTAFPSSYTVSAAQLETLFGTPIVLGDTYDMGADVYVGDKKYEAFPIGGVGNSPGPINMIGYSEFARFGAICTYDPAIYQGNFVVVSDAWGDFSPGEIVVLTRISNTSFSFIDPYAVATTPVPIVVNVNTGNNSVSITRTVIGTKWVWSNSFTGPAVATTGTSSNVTPCNQRVTLNMQYSVDQGTFSGSYPLVLRKQ